MPIKQLKLSFKYYNIFIQTTYVDEYSKCLYYFIHLLHTLAISFEEDPLDRLIFSYLHEVVYAYKNHFSSPFHICGLLI